MTAIRKEGFIIMKNLLIILFLQIITLPILAGGIGYIDYDKIVDNYKFANITKQELNMKAEELDNYLKQKNEEFKLLESPVQKNKFETEMQQEVMKRETAFNDFVKKREEVVKQKILSSIEQVRKEQGLDAVIDSDSVYSGGIDITDIVIQKLNN